MKNLQNLLSSIISSIHTLLIIAVPLFFLSLTQEFYATNKLYLLGFGVLLLLALLAVNFLLVKKIRWVNSPMDTVLVAFLIFYATSLFVSAPNKIQAVLNPTHGLAVFVFLAVFYFISVHFRAQKAIEDQQSGYLTPLNALYLSATIAAVLAILFFLNPFNNASLPSSLSYLSNSRFTPLGSQLDLALFLGFFVVFSLSSLFNKHAQRTVSSLGLSIIIIIATVLVSYALFETVPQAKTPGYEGPKSVISSLPPFSISWHGALESLKNWKTAFFGFGIDNFASVFTQVKPATYNATPLWRINFTDGRSFLLQLWAEGGLLTAGAFLLFLGLGLRMAFSDRKPHGAHSSVAHLVSPQETKDTQALRLGLLYLVVVMLFFPASLPILFIFFLVLAQVAARHASGRTRVTDLSNFTPLVGLLTALIFIAVGASAFFLGRAYLAEYYFKDSINNIPLNNGQAVYENMRQAIVLNPYIERYRISFSQLNLLLANNLASRQPDPKQLTETDRQNISQAVQAAIGEARAAVILNGQKAANWENLASIYRNLINAAQGADQWTVVSYQRAIILDPNNPIYRLNMGGVFYSLQGYKDAARFFEQAASLKPDWPNAHYNLAWASFQLKDYERAVFEMRTVLTLLDPNVNKQDYERAKKELEQFQKELPTAEEAAEGPLGPSELNLPTPPTATVEPKLRLPEDEAAPPNSEEEEATQEAQ